MAKRKRIGIPFSYSEKWVAGSYYIKNLIDSLKLLDDRVIPELCILTWKRKDFEMIRETGYPYLKYFPFNIPYNIAERSLNKISRIVRGKNSIVKKYSNKQFDVVFPY